MQQQTEYKFCIESDPFEVIIDKLRLDRLDIAIVFSNFATSAPEIGRRPLNRLNPLIYYSKSHPFAQREALCVEDFANEAFAIANESYVARNLIQSLPFVPKKIIPTNSINAIVSYIQSGEAVAVLGQNQSCRNYGDIKTVEIETPNKEGLDIIWNKNNESIPVERIIRIICSIYDEQSKE